MTDTYARLATHAAELRSKYSGLRLSEADTRSYLVDPVLRLLGYEGVEHLRREVPVPATKESLDYELLVSGEPTAIVEAKAIRQHPTDQHAAQCVQYASILGVRWCFITNGAEWLLYDAHAKGPLADKRVAAIRLDGDEESLKRAWDVLSLFARDALERSDPLASLLVERVLIDELGDPNSATVTAVRKALRARFGERVNGSVIVAATERLMLREPKQLSQQTTGDTMERTEPPLRRRRSPSEQGSRKRVTLADLVAAGLIEEGAPLEARVGGVTHIGRLRDAKLEVNGELYDSPSAASIALRKTQSFNGWVDWRYRGELLADIRARLPGTEGQQKSS